MAKQRGRPRTRPQDYGTPELIAKRRALIGEGALELAEYPLGVMLARGIIDQEQHNGGVYYAWLYGRVIGRTKVKGVLGDNFGEPEDGPFQAKIQASFRECKDAILRAGRRATDAFENVAVFEREPYWLKRELGRVHVVRDSEVAERRAIQSALAALLAVLHRGERLESFKAA